MLKPKEYYNNLSQNEICERLQKHFNGITPVELNELTTIKRYSMRELLEWCDTWEEVTNILKSKGV